jgi:hypothetical protein
MYATWVPELDPGSAADSVDVGTPTTPAAVKAATINKMSLRICPPIDLRDQ